MINLQLNTLSKICNIHLLFYFKTNNDFEIYSQNYLSKEKLEDITSLKQPLIFKYDINAKFGFLNIYNLIDKLKHNVLNINENIRETISEPPDNSEYMDDRIRKDY